MAKANFSLGMKASYGDKSKMKYLRKPAGYSLRIIKSKKVAVASDGSAVYLSGGKGRKKLMNNPMPKSMQDKFPTLYKARPQKKQKGW